MASSSILDDIVGNTGFGLPRDAILELVSRFTGNISEDEKAELVRICWQIELAHWYFVDNYCQPGSELYHLRQITFEVFAFQMFYYTPHLSVHMDKVPQALAEFRAYKNKVPVYGALLLTSNMEEVLMVQGFRNQWGFPKGKINKDENEIECAVREVFEETGTDIKHLINRDHYIEASQNDRLTRLYVVVGVKRNFSFRPQTSYEIQQIRWFSVAELPDFRKDPNVLPMQEYSSALFYTAFPYVKRLKRWILDKMDGSYRIHNFKANEGKLHSFGNIPVDFPIKPIFDSPPKLKSTQHSLLGAFKPHPLLPTPPRIQFVKRKLDFDNLGTSTPYIQALPAHSQIAQPRTSLSLAMLFGETSHGRLTGFEETKLLKKEENIDFFDGPGASAWLNFKLDPTKILQPFGQVKDSQMKTVSKPLFLY